MLGVESRSGSGSISCRDIALFAMAILGCYWVLVCCLECCLFDLQTKRWGPPRPMRSSHLSQLSIRSPLAGGHLVLYIFRTYHKFFKFFEKIMDLSLLIFTLENYRFCMKCIEFTIRTYNFKNLAVGSLIWSSKTGVNSAYFPQKISTCHVLCCILTLSASRVAWAYLELL
jgi:hypothetical protein